MNDITPNHKALELLKRIFHEVPFNQQLGVTLDFLSPDEAILHFERRDEHVGNFLHGILHGGVISAILDSAGGVIAMASIIQKNPHANLQTLAGLLGKCSTIDLHIHYLRPGRGNFFTAKGYLMKSGSKIIFTRMEFLGADNELLATGSATYRC